MAQDERRTPPGALGGLGVEKVGVWEEDSGHIEKNGKKKSGKTGMHESKKKDSSTYSFQQSY